MKRPTPLLWLIHADLFLLDQVAQPAVDFCSRRWGWHFVKIGETLCAMALAAYVAAVANFLLFHTDPFLNSLFLIVGTMFVAAVVFVVVRAARVARTSRLSAGNPNRYNLFSTRFFQWIAVVIAIEPPPTVLLAASTLLLTASYYVLSCQAGPPKEQRVPSMAVTEVA